MPRKKEEGKANLLVVNEHFNSVESTTFGKASVSRSLLSLKRAFTDGAQAQSLGLLEAPVSQIMSVPVLVLAANSFVQ